MGLLGYEWTEQEDGSGRWIKPLNVNQALNAIMRELPAIGKDGTAAPEQGGYKYRGIEQITAHLQPLLAKYGVTISPQVSLISFDHAPGMNDKWSRAVIAVDWDIEAIDGSKRPARTLGVGYDNQDKAVNKAMSQAAKYLYVELFCIADSADDADGQDYSAGEATPQARKAQASPRKAGRAAVGTAKAGTPPQPPAPDRSEQETAIKAALGTLADAADREQFRKDFRTFFGVALKDLAVERHQEAAEWASEWMDLCAREHAEAAAANP